MATESSAQKGPPPSPAENGQPGGPPAAAVPAEEQGMISVDIAGLFYQFSKTFVLIFPVYVLGYFGLSFSWLLIALVLLVWWRKNKGNKNSRLYRALAFLESEEKSVKHHIASIDLPAWVHFPDIERAEWLNKTVKHMWPYICQFIEKLFRETIEPAVRGANAHLSTFNFTKIDMGSQPLRVNGVKVYTENVDKRQIILDLQISFVGETEIDLEVKRYFCRAGVKSIQLHGTMRVVLEPLIGDVPIVGALSIFFLRKPLLEINWTGLTNMLDMPGLNGLSDTIILDIISNYLVLPNRITVPLVSDVQIAQLRFPIPKGVLRIHFLEAQDLMWKDTYMKGLVKGKSDPYGVVRLGNQVFQSKVIKENLNPKWNEVYEALVHEHPGQELEIELFDEDTDKDDFLGSLLIDLVEVEKERVVDEWFTLDEATSGKLHLKLEWLTPKSTTENLDQVLKSIKADKDQANDGLSAALLILYLDSARSLPNNPLEINHDGMKKAAFEKAKKAGKKIGSSPNPYVLFSVGHTVQESKVKYKTAEPVWEQTFTFFVHNPKRQDLEVEVFLLHLLSVSLSCSGTTLGQSPLGQIQLTIRHSSQRNKLIVVVHSCRNLIAFSEEGSDPYVRMYLLPDKRRSGRRKTHVYKKTLNPVYDQTFEFSVSLPELQRRTLDIAVKNSGGFLSRDKGLLGKLLLELNAEDAVKGWTLWYDLTEDGTRPAVSS
eukprot:XP_017950329.1 PREDICTED: extended synaptotagmin-2-A [Xenopus tropicalis]